MPKPTVTQMQSKLHEIYPELGNEPLFIIRGQDICAPTIIELYMDLAREKGVEPAFSLKVLNRAREFRDWQQAHNEVLKIPDL